MSLTDEQVGADGTWLESATGRLDVIVPDLQRVLAVLRDENDEVPVLAQQFLTVHFRPMSLADVVDTVRRSVGILGFDLVT